MCIVPRLYEDYTSKITKELRIWHTVTPHAAKGHTATT